MKNIIAAFMVIGTAIGGLSATAKEEKAKIIELTVGKSGFEPKEINVKPGTNVTLKVTRKTDVTCSKAIQVPAKKIEKDLPLNKPVMIALGKLEKGEIKFGCGMDMMDAGQIFVK